MIRCKMSVTNISDGERGVEHFLSAVYEGNQELQEISENAVFGKATPSGTMTILTDQPKPDHPRFMLEMGEEYYVDLAGPEEPHDMTSGVLMIVDLSCRYISKPMGQTVSFRHIATDGEVVSLSIGVQNPEVIAWLRDHPEVSAVVRKVYGRRSNAEIAIRRRMLEEHERDENDLKTRYPEAYQSRREMLKKKLRRAEGGE